MNEDLRRLRKLLAAATPGSWEVRDALGSPPIIEKVVFEPVTERIVASTGQFPDSQAQPDAQLIAELHNAASALLDELEAFRAVTLEATKR